MRLACATNFADTPRIAQRLDAARRGAISPPGPALARERQLGPAVGNGGDELLQAPPTVAPESKGAPHPRRACWATPSAGPRAGSCQSAALAAP